MIERLASKLVGYASHKVKTAVGDAFVRRLQRLSPFIIPVCITGLDFYTYKSFYLKTYEAAKYKLNEGVQIEDHLIRGLIDDYTAKLKFVAVCFNLQEIRIVSDTDAIKSVKINPKNPKIWNVPIEFLQYAFGVGSISDHDLPLFLYPPEKMPQNVRATGNSNYVLVYGGAKIGERVTFNLNPDNFFGYVQTKRGSEYLPPVPTIVYPKEIVSADSRIPYGRAICRGELLDAQAVYDGDVEPRGIVAD